MVLVCIALQRTSCTQYTAKYSTEQKAHARKPYVPELDLEIGRMTERVVGGALGYRSAWKDFDCSLAALDAGKDSRTVHSCDLESGVANPDCTLAVGTAHECGEEAQK